jgi:hypothetical protein
MCAISLEIDRDSKPLSRKNGIILFSLSTFGAPAPNFPYLPLLHIPGHESEEDHPPIRIFHISRDFLEHP